MRLLFQRHVHIALGLRAGFFRLKEPKQAFWKRPFVASIMEWMIILASRAALKYPVKS